MNIIDQVVKEARWVKTAEDWQEKIVEHKTPTGQTRKVKVKSLSPEEQEKYKPQKEEKKKVLHKVLDKVKNWKEEHQKFFRGGQEPDSEERKGFANFIKRKSKGIVQSIKKEIKEWPVAAGAVKKIFKKEKLSKDEKKAMFSVGKQIAFTAGSVALTGGLASASIPLATMGKHLALKLVRSTALGAVKDSLLFAGKEMTDDRALEIFIHDMANAFQKANISEEDWLEAASKTDL